MLHFQQEVKLCRPVSNLLACKTQHQSLLVFVTLSQCSSGKTVTLVTGMHSSTIMVHFGQVLYRNRRRHTCHVP